MNEADPVAACSEGCCHVNALDWTSPLLISTCSPKPISDPADNAAVVSDPVSSDATKTNATTTLKTILTDTLRHIANAL